MTPEEIIDRNNKLYHPEMDAKYVRLEAAIKSMHDYNRAFKSALREEIEKEKQDYIKIRDGWKERSHQWHTYDLVVRILDKRLISLDSLTPKK